MPATGSGWNSKAGKDGKKANEANMETYFKSAAPSQYGSRLASPRHSSSSQSPLSSREQSEVACESITVRTSRPSSCQPQNAPRSHDAHRLNGVSPSSHIRATGQSQNAVRRYDSLVSSPLSSLPSPQPVTSIAQSKKPSELRNPEIGASDDDGNDDNFSDDSLEDLPCLLGRSNTIAVTEKKAQPSLCVIPMIKRTATESRASQTTAVPKHKFDLEALAKHARRDDATTASCLKLQQAAKAAQEARHRAQAPHEDTITGLLKEEGGQAHKVLRAMQRSEMSQTQGRYFFFTEHIRIPSVPAAPKLPGNSPWNLLTHGSAKAREQNLISGLPQNILVKKGGLPDSMFLWILDSLCIEKSVVARHEYCNMIATCPEQVERILTPPRLQRLFGRFGARDLDVSSKLTSSSDIDVESYYSRDWSCVQSLLRLLRLVADQLSVQSTQLALRTLVQLALDRLLSCNIELFAEFGPAVEGLAAAIPSSSWDTFVSISNLFPNVEPPQACTRLTHQCTETCSFLRTKAPSRSTLVTALVCLPISASRTHDLRRRIAISALFEDDHQDSRDEVSLRDVIDRLGEDDFAVHHDTDFAELRARFVLLDLAIDDGLVIHFDDVADEKTFNSEVDELAALLRDVWRKINDAGMKLVRTEAKSAVECVQQRLSHCVRTRRKAKKTPFHVPGLEDPSLTLQKDFMKKFFQRKAVPATVETDAFVDCSG